MDSESIYPVLKKLFKVLSVQISDKDIRLEILKYQGTDRLKSVSKMLNYWQISAVIKNKNSNELVGINEPFLTQLGNRLVLVNKFAETEVIVSDVKLRNHTLTPREFTKDFNGQIIEISLRQRLDATDYRKELVNRTRIPVFLAGLFSLLLLYVITNAVTFSAFYVWALLILKLAGLSISVLLLFQTIDKDNSLIRGICGADKRKNCNAILSSEAANITEELSWSEVGFFYFAGSLLVLFFNPGDQATRMFLLLINIASLPYTYYSIYYQWRLARQWCVLCCLVQGILWLEFFTFLSSYPPFRYPDFKEVTRIIMGFSTPILAWIFFKPIFLSSKLTSDLTLQLNRFKYNEEVFTKFLHESEPVVQIAENDTLIIGSPNAPSVITMIVNPYCRHCARVYKSLNTWLPARKDIKLQLIFSTGNDKNKMLIAEDLMSIYLNGNSRLTRQAVKAWFGQRQKWYGRWAQKYIAPANDHALTAVMRQANWCEEAKISATPVLLINGFKLPSLYRVDDLKYLI